VNAPLYGRSPGLEIIGRIRELRLEQRHRGSVAVMSRRGLPVDALDDFPTPPFATRALFEVVLPRLGVERVGRVREPACGRGIMSGVIAEYAERVTAGDVFDYGHGFPVRDYLDQQTDIEDRAFDWIITNPPFNLALAVALRALDQVGAVAFLCRSNWAEGLDRYERLFRDRPPTLIAQFVERVPMVKGRWAVNAKSATAYSWFVWIKGEAPRPLFWIPPGQRRRLSRDTDVLRFGGVSVLNSPAWQRRFREAS
jgi:hypothetical protein